jgi:hypothetical protein
LGFSQATFTSNRSGGWSDSAALTTPWVITGFDSDKIPDFDDNIVISNGNTITLTKVSNAFDVNILFGGNLLPSGQILSIRGSFSNSSNSSLSGLNLWFSSSGSKTLSSSSTINFNGLVNIGATLNISSGTILTIASSNLVIRNGGTINNSGVISCLSINTLSSTGNILNNLSTGTISVSSNLPSSGLTINNSNGSTFNYNSGTTSILNTTYHHLGITNNSKSVSGNLSVNGNLTITTSTLSLGSNNLSVSGNLSNSGTISSSGTLNIAGALTFNGSGNLSSNNTSTIVLNGSGASQTITIPNAITVPFYNLTCSNSSGVSISVVGSGKCSIKNILTINSGTFNVGSNILTMLSDASLTAIIGNSAGTINGSMILQRYIQAGVYRKYDLGSTVTSTTIDDWDNELFMSIGATNDGSTPAYLGGDGAAGGTKSVFIYDNQLNTSKKYVAVNTGTTLTPGRGYQTLIADDITGFPGRAIDSRGTPNMGSISLPVFMTGTDGFNLVSNPFQAEIDWANVTKSNVSNTVYFIEYNGTKSTYLTPRSNPKINPGLGFMCVATGANPSVSITQNAKTSNTASTFGARLSQLTDEVSDLKLRISSSQNAEYNEAHLFFDKKAISGFDFEKDFLFGESLIEEAPVITFIDAGKLFVRNYFNDENETDYFPLSITTPIAGNYSIDLEGLYESNAYQDAYLINNLTKEKYSLTNNNSASIYFDKVENEQFQLVLSKKSNVEDVFNSTSNLISVFATSNNLVIKNSANQMQQFDLKVYNVLGQMLFEQSNTVSGKSEVNIPTEFLKSDIYIVKLKTFEGNEITKKVVLTK